MSILLNHEESLSAEFILFEFGLNSLALNAAHWGSTDLKIKLEITSFFERIFVYCEPNGLVLAQWPVIFP